MQYRHLPILLVASLLRLSCSSAPASAPAPTPASPSPARTEARESSPAEAAAKLSGFWLVTVQRGGQSLDHSMHISLTEGLLVGSLTGTDGNSHEVSKITLQGDKVSWEVGGERMAQRFEGKLNGSSMEGKVKMVRGSRGGSRGQGQGKGGGQSGDDGGDSPASPPGEGQAPSGGGRGGQGRGGRGRGGRGGATSEVTWKAFRSVEPPSEATPAPAKPAGDLGQVLALDPSRREGFSAGTAETVAGEGLGSAPPDVAGRPGFDGPAENPWRRCERPGSPVSSV